MACNNCGNTSSSPCACHDHGLTTPCSLSPCETGSDGRGWPEFCADTFCIHCVTNCRNSFQAPNGSDQYIYANAGEKLDIILQRMFLFATQPTCFNLSIPHLWCNEEATTATTVTLRWDSVPQGVNQIDVQYAEVNAADWNTDTGVDLTPATNEYTVGNNVALIPNTVYKFRLVSNNGACTSVELLVRTLNA